MNRPFESIHSLTRRYIGWLLAIIALTSLTLALLGHSLLSKNAAKEEGAQRQMLAENLGNVVAFYQSVVDQLAKQPDISDIIAFGDSASAEQWAHQVRLLMPESIGMALVDSAGNVMGEPLTLRLGPACVDDVQRTLRGGKISKPPVHREVESLAHFDITSPVHDASGQIIGMVFASFRLTLLQRHLERMTMPGAFLRVDDAAGNILAEGGKSDAELDHHAVGHIWSTIPNTDWQLHLMLPQVRLDPILIWIVIAGLVIFFLGSAVVAVLVEHLLKAFAHDMGLIQQHLHGVLHGRRAETILASRFRETHKIIGDIGMLVEDIAHYQQQLDELSITDELTGLLNRRGFLRRLDEMLHLAERDIASVLVVFDLDHFKTCNDRYGHAVGDAVLQTFATALRARCRNTDLCARLGGDEFAVVLVNWQHHEVDSWYHTVADLFLRGQQTLCAGQGIEQACTPSAGAVILDGRYPSTMTALQAADEQLYHIKHSGRSAIAFDRPLA